MDSLLLAQIHDPNSRSCVVDWVNSRLDQQVKLVSDVNDQLVVELPRSLLREFMLRFSTVAYFI